MALHQEAKENRHVRETSLFRIEARETGRTYEVSHVLTSISSQPGTGRSRAQRRNVLISGAGPASLTLAYWLSRHGVSGIVVERAPAPRDGGQAVDIRGAAIDVARRAGILGALRQARTRTRGMTYPCGRSQTRGMITWAFRISLRMVRNGDVG